MSTITTSIAQYSSPDLRQDPFVREFMTKWGPAIAEGICNGIINSANPFNVILIPYYKAMLIAEVTGLTLNESYHFVRHLHYKATGQQAAADDELAKCIAPLQGLTQVWNTITTLPK